MSKQLFVAMGLTITTTLATIAVTAWHGAEAYDRAPLIGDYVDRAILPNPYAHIPAQCYVETSGGTQNACQFCHTDGLAKKGFGNNSPQSGASLRLGNLQQEYGFVALNYPFIPNGSINPWENTLFPEKLLLAVARLGEMPTRWDMEDWINTDNWAPAYLKRPGSSKDWDAGQNHAMRLFPGLDPADLPASPDDGFVRSANKDNGFFEHGGDWITGWRAVNFFPYGIFTPLTGSVSGIYLRLPAHFMKNADGQFDLAIYESNLDLVARAVQDRLGLGETYYRGQASDQRVEPGLYPLGTEFAHPLHYVDVAADGSDGAASPFPGTRAKRVKEVRYMYKSHRWQPDYGGPGTKEEDAPVYGNGDQGWVDNGAGWLMSGFIEDAKGDLRPQTLNELVSCVGCHSGNAPQPETGHASFNSGTGNTVDSTWSLPRAYAGALGWREMDYLGYRAKSVAADENAIPGTASRGDAVNRAAGKGEFRTFLDNVVGISLYGDMPASVEAFLAQTIRKDRGYPADWPKLDTSSTQDFLDSQRLRQTLLRAMTRRGDYLADDLSIQPALLYPPQRAALEAARRYRQVVATQRYHLGKDVFAETPVTYRYFRTAETAFAHQDGRPYKEGEIVLDRPVETDPANVTYGIGTATTLIDMDVPFEQGGTANPDYMPLLDFMGK